MPEDGSAGWAASLTKLSKGFFGKGAFNLKMVSLVGAVTGGFSIYEPRFIVQPLRCLLEGASITAKTKMRNDAPELHHDLKAVKSKKS